MCILLILLPIAPLSIHQHLRFAGPRRRWWSHRWFLLLAHQEVHLPKCVAPTQVVVFLLLTLRPSVWSEDYYNDRAFWAVPTDYPVVVRRNENEMSTYLKVRIGSSTLICSTNFSFDRIMDRRSWTQISIRRRHPTTKPRSSAARRARRVSSSKIWEAHGEPCLAFFHILVKESELHQTQTEIDGN